MFLFTRLFIGGPSLQRNYARGTLLKSFWSVRPLASQTNSRIQLQEGQYKKVEIHLKAEALEDSPTKQMDPFSPLSEATTGRSATTYDQNHVDKRRGVKLEARRRVELEELVEVSSAYRTLFYGLRRNHEHNMAVVHPILFIMRRILYAIAIVYMQGESLPLFAALILLVTCLVMLGTIVMER